MGSQKNYFAVGIIALTFCVLALYIYQHRQGQTGRVDKVLVSVAGQMQKGTFYFGSGIRSTLDHYLFLVGAKKKSEDLEREVSGLKSQLAAMEEVELENRRLREALQFKDVVKPTLLSARVVAHDVSTDYFAIRIDRGSNDGLTPGMGVLSTRGVVGRVHRVTAKYSDVLTLFDPSSNIDGIIQRSRARGVISGQTKQLTCKMKYVDQLEDVRVDDMVVSSGYGGIFPKGLLIGYVSSVLPNPSGVLQTVSIRPAVDIYRLEEVFVVIPSAKPEATS